MFDFVRQTKKHPNPIFGRVLCGEVAIAKTQDKLTKVSRQ